MDFDLDKAQASRLDLLRTVVADLGGTRPYSEDLDGALRADKRLTGPELSLLDRLLLVEEAARLGAPMGATSTLLLEPLMPAKRPPGAMAVRDADAQTPVRDGACATSLFVVDEAGARFGAVHQADISPVLSGFGEGYAVVSSGELQELDWPLALGALRAYQLGLVAEIAGASRAAVEIIVRHLSERRQFGQALSEFQALRHRLSERAVDVEGTSVLARFAADQADPTSVDSAIAYATRAAAQLAPELHQLAGARGFLHEFGLADYTMRIEALRIELGGVRRTSIRHADTAWS